MASQRHGIAGKTAVVIGASMGGLLAARALASHYEQVTVLERDAFPEPGENRRGVPQGRHAHALLVQGLRTMEESFPGLTAQLIAHGADYGDVSEKARWWHEGGYHRPCTSGHNAINVSRPLLEATVRMRLLELPNVRVVESCDVLGLMPTPDRSRVTGVRLIRRKAGSAEESLMADLVVDAGGRGSRGPAWLEELGYERPREEIIKIGVTYTSCEYRRRPEHLPGIVALIVAASPRNRRGGVLLSQEGGRWMLTVAGYLGEQPPLNHAGLCEYARGLAAPEIYEVIKGAEPLGEPVGHKIPSNLRRRYDRLARFPKGYLVLGDALCSFNPTYAQGMSVAALEAAALDACLRQGDEELAARFFKRASAIIDMPWSTAVGNDLRLLEIEGPRSAMTRFVNWYVGKLHRAAHHDPLLSVAFLKVINLMEPPPSLMRPALMWRVLRGNLRRRAGRSPADSERAVVARGAAD
jgi:2-polyprenyl-6-methoxyphenol hydroxylase-like FAD-dependent oxidoreductase